MRTFYFILQSNFMRQNKYFRLKRQKSLAQTKSTLTTIKSRSRLLYSESKKVAAVDFSPKKSRKFNPQKQSLLWIYFDKDAKDTYHKNTIDNYFRSDISLRKAPIGTAIKNKFASYKNSNKLLHSERATATKNIQIFKNQLKTRRKQIFGLQLKIQDHSCLPTITENSMFQKRPISEHKKIKLSQSSHQIHHQQLILSQSSKKSISSSQSIQQTYQCSFYETFTKTKPTIDVEDKLKQFTDGGLKFYDREIKMEKYNIPLIWKGGNDHHLEGKKVKCLRQELYTIRKESDSKFTISPKTAYYRLFSNNNEGLVNIIIALCRQFIKIKDKVINPKININTIYRIQQRKVIMEWGTSAFQDILKIRQFFFTSYQNPVIGDSNQWLAVPEYLSPQIIRDSINNWDSKQIWQCSTSTHIWQLGCLILQLLVLNPLWMPYFCSVKNFHKYKKGLLCTKSRTLIDISVKHKTFITSGIRNALKQTVIPAQKIRPQILKIINRCFKQNPKERITPQQIISLLQF